MDFAAWRARARELLARNVSPEHADWSDPHAPSLLPPHDDDTPPASGVPRVSARLLRLLEDAFCHRSERRLPLMYRLLWRATHGESALLDDAADDDVHALRRMQHEVEHDVHKMHAFVRFREVRVETEASRWIAWYEPAHDILRRAAPFFVRRFGTMVWTIATPDGIATWDRGELAFRPPDPTHRAPHEDAGEHLWLAYYRAIFNPARLNVRTMKQHMPTRYWHNLPEARLIPDLAREAAPRVAAMLDAQRDETLAHRRAIRVADASVPAGIAHDRSALDACRRCELWQRATQAVPGVGPRDSGLMLVGEQPGDEEDLQGRPFVGPAGQLLREVMRQASIDPERVYITNAAKHYSWEPRGKRRIHKTPGQRAIDACRTFLDAEIAHCTPRVIVALGATAARALLGASLGIGDARLRDDLHHACGAQIIVTYHPAAVLRADGPRRRELHEALTADLARAAHRAGVDRAVAVP